MRERERERERERGERDQHTVLLRKKVMLVKLPFIPENKLFLLCCSPSLLTARFEASFKINSTYDSYNNSQMQLLPKSHPFASYHRDHC